MREAGATSLNAAASGGPHWNLNQCQLLTIRRLWQLPVNPLHGPEYASGLRLVSDVACWQFPRLSGSRRGQAGLLGLPCALQEVAHEVAVHLKLLWLSRSTMPGDDHVDVARQRQRLGQGVGYSTPSPPSGRVSAGRNLPPNASPVRSTRIAGITMKMPERFVEGPK